MTLVLWAHAKVNPGLRVCGRLPGGYHELDILFHSICLADRVEITVRPGEGLVLEVDGPFARQVPQDRAPEDNLACQAAVAFGRWAAQRLAEGQAHSRGKAVAGPQWAGPSRAPAAGQVEAGARALRAVLGGAVTLRLTKNIPAQAGLGGGSADAAAVLRGLALLWQKKEGLAVPGSALAAMAQSLGADVAFCLQGGAARGRGRGDVLEQLPTAPAWWVVLARPPVGLGTADVYKAWDSLPRPNETGEEAGPLSCGAAGPRTNPRFAGAGGALPGPTDSDLGRIVDAWRRGDLAAFSSSVFNDLQEPALRLCPQIGAVRAALLAAGAPFALVAGSGTTVWTACSGQDEALDIARRLQSWSGAGGAAPVPAGTWVALSRLCEQGVVVAAGEQTGAEAGEGVHEQQVPESAPVPAPVASSEE